MKYYNRFEGCGKWISLSFQDSSLWPLQLHLLLPMKQTNTDLYSLWLFTFNSQLDSSNDGVDNENNGCSDQEDETEPLMAFNVACKTTQSPIFPHAIANWKTSHNNFTINACVFCLCTNVHFCNFYINNICYQLTWRVLDHFEEVWGMTIFQDHKTVLHVQLACFLPTTMHHREWKIAVFHVFAWKNLLIRGHRVLPLHV